MTTFTPSAPALPRSYSQRYVAQILATYMVEREGLIVRSDAFDWDEADRTIRERWSAKELKRVRRMAWRIAAERLGMLPV